MLKASRASLGTRLAEQSATLEATTGLRNNKLALVSGLMWHLIRI